MTESEHAIPAHPAAEIARWRQRGHSIR